MSDEYFEDNFDFLDSVWYQLSVLIEYYLQMYWSIIHHQPSPPTVIPDHRWNLQRSGSTIPWSFHAHWSWWNDSELLGQRTRNFIILKYAIDHQRQSTQNPVAPTHQHFNPKCKNRRRLVCWFHCHWLVLRLSFCSFCWGVENVLMSESGKRFYRSNRPRVRSSKHGEAGGRMLFSARLIFITLHVNCQQS